MRQSKPKLQKKNKNKQKNMRQSKPKLQKKNIMNYLKCANQNR